MTELETTEQAAKFRSQPEAAPKTRRTTTGVELTGLDGAHVVEKTASTANLRLVTPEPAAAAQAGEQASPQAGRPEAAKTPGRQGGNVFELFARPGAAAPDARVSKAVNSARAGMKEPGATGKPDAAKAVAAPKAPTVRRAA